MNNKEEVNRILNEYAVKVGHENWNELVGYCNNDPEEMAAHYELMLANYIQNTEKKPTIFQNGMWYVFKEPGQEKLLIRVENAEKMICSGWDCKGKQFRNQWMFLSNRFELKAEKPDHVQIINEIFDKKLNR